MTQKPKAKMNIPMCAACILLCLTLFSIHLTSGLYAKYIAKGTGSDEARVAKFDVSVANSDDVVINISTEVHNGVYTFQVNNTSEVAVKYDLVLTFEDNVSSFLSVKLGDRTEDFAGGKTVTFTDVESIAPSSMGASQQIVFTVTDSSSFALKANGGNYEESFGFSAVINCEQID